MYLLCRKRARIRNSGWFFLYRKVHNRRYVAVFNWRERTKKTYFSEKKNLWTSLPHIFNFSQSKNFRSIKSHLWYIVPRQKTSEVCYQMWAGESLVNKHHRLQMQIFIGRLWGETYVRMEKKGIWLVQAGKDLNHSVKIWWILQPEIW